MFQSKPLNNETTHQLYEVLKEAKQAIKGYVELYGNQKAAQCAYSLIKNRYNTLVRKAVETSNKRQLKGIEESFDKYCDNILESL